MAETFLHGVEVLEIDAGYGVLTVDANRLVTGRTLVDHRNGGFGGGGGGGYPDYYGAGGHGIILFRLL